MNVESGALRKLSTVSQKDIDRIIYGDHHDPFAVLGMHQVWLDDREVISVRVFAPEVEQVAVVEPGAGSVSHRMAKINGMGFYEILFPDRRQRFRYQLQVVDFYGRLRRLYDPYAFSPQLTQAELESFTEGNLWEVYNKLGAHPTILDGVNGVQFAVWAPSARRVSVVGNFNRWDGRRHPMRRHFTGVWEIFIPELVEEELYKFEIKTRDGHLRLKSDPFAVHSELHPATASFICDPNKFIWRDESWRERRHEVNRRDRPIAIYEVHLGSWKRKLEPDSRWFTYRESAEELAVYLSDLGFTHVELMPIMEHPHDDSWGYHISGYYATTSRFGRPRDFAYFVDCMHRHGLGVILDWVPGHFSKHDNALRWFDGAALFEHTDARLAEHPAGNTLIFNFGRNEIRNFLISNALFWLDKYHVDGLRVESLAEMLYLDFGRQPGEWLPNKFGGREHLEAIAFLKQLNEVVHEKIPGRLTIAEAATAWHGVTRPTYLGGLGFSLQWNSGWRSDFLHYLQKEPVHRQFHQNLLTFPLQHAFSESFILPFSHDLMARGRRALPEKMPGDMWQKFANLRLALGFMYGHPGKKLLFMGCEFGQCREWDPATSLDWHLLEQEQHRKLRDYVRDLNHLYRREPALFELDDAPAGFEWIDHQDAQHSLLSFYRRGRDSDEIIVFACNFTPVPRLAYRIGVPLPGFYQELLNSDSQHYGGSNLGNAGGVQAQNFPYHQQPFSIEINFPPLAVVIFKYRPGAA